MSLKVTAVLCDEVYKDVETVCAFSAEIVEKKNASALIQKLNEHFPLQGLGHLKRVKADGDKLYILLGTKKLFSKLDFEGNEDLVGLTNFCEVEVPVSKPITRAQYESARTLWPTQFHENKRLENALKGMLFSADETLIMKQYMESALSECSKANSDQDPVGAVVVDPDRRCIVAKCCSSTYTHPLKHAVMVCLDAVAATQGGGAWAAGRDGVSLLQEEEGGLAERLEGEAQGKHCMPPVKKHKPSKQYLCTGYDLYVTMEPCVMCAMALVHSRIRRVFYATSNPSAGGLGTHFKIHVQAGLNHHFEVYSIVER